MSETRVHKNASLAYLKEERSFLSCVWRGAGDIRLALARMRVVRVFGWQDIRTRYKRSVLGPIWITISMAIMIAAMGLVFGQVTRAPLRDYVPFLCLGVVFWAFISNTIIEGCSAFVSNTAIIRQMPMPFSVYLARNYWRNLLIFTHNIVIYPVVAVIAGRGISWQIVLLVPGFILLTLNLLWMSACLAILCTRYRDVIPIIRSTIQVFFYLTPILWMPSALNSRAATKILAPNPANHLLSIVRDPIMGQTVPALSWMVCSGMAVAGWVVALALLGRYKGRIAYWL